MPSSTASKRLTLTAGAVLATALLVALVITSLATVWGLVVSGSWSWEGFFGFGAIIFVFAFIGGVVFGLPAIKLVEGTTLVETAPRTAIFGALVGGFAGAVMAILLFGFSRGILGAALPFSAGLGAVSGAIAGPFWFCFNRLLERKAVEHA